MQELKGAEMNNVKVYCHLYADDVELVYIYKQNRKSSLSKSRLNEFHIRRT